MSRQCGSALLDHLVIFFHDQPLTSESFMAFAQAFGTPVHYPLINGIDGFPFIIEVVKREDQTSNFGGIWHADTTYLDEPPMGSMLYAQKSRPLAATRCLPINTSPMRPCQKPLRKFLDEPDRSEHIGQG